MHICATEFSFFWPSPPFRNILHFFVTLPASVPHNPHCCALEFPFHFYFLLFAPHLTSALLDVAPDYYVLISLFLCVPAHPHSTHSCAPRLTPSVYHYNKCLYELQCANSNLNVFGYPCSFSRGYYVRKFDKGSQLFTPSSSMTYYHPLEIQFMCSQFLDIFFSTISIQWKDNIL